MPEVLYGFAVEKENEPEEKTNDYHSAHDDPKNNAMPALNSEAEESESD